MNNKQLTPSTITTLRGLITLMRLKQWLKNGFVFAPLLFTSQFTDILAIQQVCIAALFFSIASSITYIFNDIRDIKQDRLHPTKSKTRPLASGVVSIPQAILLMVILLAVLAVGFLIIPKVLLVICAYLGLNLLYTIYLKYQPVLDIFSIAIGFVLRVYAGAVALNVPLSGWMFVTTLCIALYLASIKRQQELSHNGSNGREVLEKYTLPLIKQYSQTSATGAVFFYSIFVMSTKPQLVITIPLVLFCLFRYWYIVEELGAGESPTDALFADRYLLLTLLLGITLIVWILWPVKG